MSALEAGVGSLSWKSKALKDINFSREATMRADNACRLGNTLNPPSNLREVLADASNAEAIKHFRETRQVVSKLKDSLLNINEEIKALTRSKTNLEKTLDNIMKDYKLNQMSADSRISRPSREKERDVADDLLHGEKLHLQNMKRALEIQMKNVRQQLLILDQARKKLNDVMQERTRVLELICHSLPAAARNAKSGLRRSHSHIGLIRRQSSMNQDISECNSPTEYYSESLTPEANNAMSEAKIQIDRSSNMRKEIIEMICKTELTLKAVRQSVNEGFSRKINESYSLKQQLVNESENNRNTVNRVQRFYNNTEKSFYFSKGPLASADLLVKEKYDRPIINVYQRHSPNYQPRVRKAIRGGESLLESLKATTINLHNMELAGSHVRQNIQNKKAAIDIDSNIIRNRRRKADHRWIPQTAY